MEDLETLLNGADCEVNEIFCDYFIGEDPPGPTWNLFIRELDEMVRRLSSIVRQEQSHPIKTS